MRTNNNWKVVEPIIELRNTEELYEIVDIAKKIKYWNPDPYLWLQNEYELIQSMVWAKAMCFMNISPI